MSKRVINILFSISLGIMLLLTILTYNRLTTFRNYADVVSHSLAVQNDIVAMKSSYRSLIANQRSYLITKEELYYDTFQNEKDSLRHTVEHFKKLTKENEVHQNYIYKIEENVNNRIQSLLVEIINDSSSAAYKFSQMELIQRNKELNDDFATTVSALYQYEKSLMNRQLQLKETQEKLTPLLMLLSALVSIGLLAYSFYLTSSELKQRQLTEEQLYENIENLNRSNKELEQYAYVASHDLQEPLRKMRTFADRLNSKYGDQLPSDGKDMLDRIDASSEKMAALIDDLLSLSRLLSNKEGFQTVNLKELVQEVSLDLNEQLIAVEGNIKIGDLPEVQGSHGQLRQLFHNLMGNAIKFAKPNVPLHLRVNVTNVSEWEGDEKFNYYKVSVRDNGVGFDNMYLDKMFTIFGRLHRTEHIQGTGIGLSICRRIMENHEGFISAEGKPNEGAIFYLYFPNSNY